MVGLRLKSYLEDLAKKVDRVYKKFMNTKYTCKINKDDKGEARLKAMELAMTYVPLGIFRIFKREYYENLEFNIKDGFNKAILRKKFADYEKKKEEQKKKNKLKREAKLQQQSSQVYSKNSKKSKVSNNASLMNFFAPK